MATGRPKGPKKAPAPKKAREMRSGFERKIAAALTAKDVPYEYEQERIPYTIPASTHYYVPDFKLPNGIYVEGKGIFDRETRAKMMLVIEQNPDKDIRILFMRNNKLTRTAKQTYGEWCDKKGIVWAVSSKGEVPDEWINHKPNPRTLVERVLAEPEAGDEGASSI